MEKEKVITFIFLAGVAVSGFQMRFLEFAYSLMTFKK